MERERGGGALGREEGSQRGALFMAVSLGHTQGLAREHFLYWFILHSVICVTHISVNKRNQMRLWLHACIVFHWHSRVARLVRCPFFQGSPVTVSIARTDHTAGSFMEKETRCYQILTKKKKIIEVDQWAWSSNRLGNPGLLRVLKWPRYTWCHLVLMNEWSN